MLCFEIRVNDGPPIVAGKESLSVLAAHLTHVAERNELRINVGGLITSALGDSEHLDWLDATLKVGDTVTMRVIESESTTSPVASRRADPEAVEAAKRRYYEMLKMHYGD